MAELDAALAAGFPVEGRWGYAERHRVRWCEMDMFGHANHKAHLAWFEDARVGYMRDAGLPPLSPTTPGPTLAKIEVSYLKALAMDETILVTARVARFRNTSFTMEYAIWRADGCVATGTALCVLMINATGEKVPIPAAMRRLIQERDGGIPE